MTSQDFTTTIMVSQTREAAFRAITNVRGWWSEDIEGGTALPNDEFTYRYKDVHHCHMQLVDIIPNEKVVWLCTDNYFKFTEDKTEWTGTRLCFDITETDGQTQVRFTHVGLVPSYECFDVCTNAWSKYLNHSLKNLIETGQGQPNKKGA